MLLTYGTGVVVGPFLSLEPLLLVCVLFLLVGTAGLALWTNRRILATILVLFGFLLFGSLRFALMVHPQGRFHLSKVSDASLTGKVEVEGIIVSSPESFPPGGGWRREERLRFLLQVEEINLEGVDYPATGGARLSIIAPVQEYHYGHRIRGHFRLRRPRGYWNPGAFNYRRYALTRGFNLEGWGWDREEVQILNRAGGFWILRRIFDLREAMLKKIRAGFPGEEGGMLRAIVLGDRSGLSPETRDVFLNSGTYHILVISGLHLGFLAGALFFLARCLRLPRAVSSLLTVLGVVFYSLLTGGSPPIVRAALMVSLYLLALILGRDRDLLNTLGLAAFLLLLWNPLYLFDAGFQLTFVATGAILVVLNRFDLSRFPRLSRWVLASLLASTAATVGTAPLLALHFNRASLTGIVANLLIVPLGGCLTAAGMAYSLLLLPLQGGISFFESGISFVARGMIHVASVFAWVPLASIRLYTPTVLMVLTCYTIFALMVFPGVRRRGLALGVTSMLLIGQVAWKLFPIERPGIEATFLDVGQGDAIFLELPGGRTMLVDGGGSVDSRFDIGERVVVPYLWHRWVRRLDVVVLSHPQPDHMNGLRAVLENIPVGEIWESGYPSASPTYDWLQAFVREQGIPLRRMSRGQRIQLGSEVMVTALHPPRPFLHPRKKHRSAVVNNNSLVLRVDHPEVRLLLTGDIEREGEASLLDTAVVLQADLLKVPHHGSRGSSSTSFLRQVRPRWAVIQAGDRNPFGHPHPETLKRYAVQGVQVFRTDRDGAITFAFRNGAVAIRSYRRQLGVWGGTEVRFAHRGKV
ncbi:MAG: DNA internalization-related competence protein ComEC/Rec2 [Candidatus Methylomirabilales bacterium]